MAYKHALGDNDLLTVEYSIWDYTSTRQIFEKSKFIFGVSSLTKQRTWFDMYISCYFIKSNSY